MSNHKKGFTLVELLLVISVIGLLTSIVLVNLGGARDQARIANILRTQAQINRLLGADLVGWWNFDDVALTPIPDLSGGGNAGTCSGASCPSVSEDIVPGTRGRARRFDGGDFITVSHSTSLNITEALTVKAWVRFEGLDYTNNTGGLRFIGAKGHPDAVTSHRGWWFVYDNRNNLRSFRFTCFGNSMGGFGGGGNNFSSPTYDVQFENGRWYFLGFTITTTEARLYIDGVQHGPIRSISNLQLSDVTRNLFIGGNVGFWNGLIDDVRIYSRALTASEIQTLYAQTKDNYLADSK